MISCPRISGAYNIHSHSSVYRLRSLDAGKPGLTFTENGWHRLGATEATGSFVAISSWHVRDERSITVLWDLRRDRRLGQFSLRQTCWSLAVTPGGQVLWGGADGRVVLYDWRSTGGSPQHLARLDDSVTVLHVSRDGAHAVASDGKTASWVLLDIKNRKTIRRVQLQEGPSTRPTKGSWQGFFGNRLVNWETGRTVCALRAGRFGRLELRLLPGRKGILGYFAAARMDFYRDHALHLYDLSGTCVSTKSLVDSQLAVSVISQGNRGTGYIFS